MSKMRKYTITIASDQEHEQVVAEIYDGNQFIALINQDDGIDQLKIEFPGVGLEESLICRTVNMKQFLQAVDEAVRELIG